MFCHHWLFSRQIDQIPGKDIIFIRGNKSDNMRFFNLSSRTVMAREFDLAILNHTSLPLDLYYMIPIPLLSGQKKPPSVRQLQVRYL